MTLKWTKEVPRGRDLRIDDAYARSESIAIDFAPSVYVARSGRLIKVGATTCHPRTRLYRHRSGGPMGAPLERLRLSWWIRVPGRNGCVWAVESLLQSIAASMFRRVGDEWYVLPPGGFSTLRRILGPTGMLVVDGLTYMRELNQLCPTPDEGAPRVAHQDHDDTPEWWEDDPHAECWACGGSGEEGSACIDDLCHGGEIPCRYHGDWDAMQCQWCKGQGTIPPPDESGGM